MGAEIDRIGMVKRKVNPDLFSALISSIISQQISTKSAATVKSRLIELTGGLTPEDIDKTEIGEIQKCGMSTRKAGYIKNVSQIAISKKVNFKNLYKLEDEVFIKELVKLKGVGKWTAEMLLIHSLERKNILSYSDLGIRRGIKILYGLEELSKEDFKIFQNRYTPYGTVASLYLWRISSEKQVLYIRKEG